MPRPFVWLSGPQADLSDRLKVVGVGWREAMPATLVDRPVGTGEYLFMHFHSPVQVFVDGQLRAFPAHRCVLWKPGERQTFGDTARPWVHSWVMCNGLFVREAIASAGLPTGAPFDCHDAYLAERWLKPLHEELSQTIRPDAVVAESLLTIWLRGIRRCVMPEPSPLPERLRAVLHLMETDLASPLRLADLAAMAHASVSGFSADFRKHLGLSPMQHLLRMRMNRSLHLLRDRNLSIAQVATQVGFVDPFYFARQFRRHHGESPREHRRRVLGGEPT